MNLQTNIPGKPLEQRGIPRHRSEEVVVEDMANGRWRRSRSLHHRMLPPSLRLLVRHQARSVPLQLQRYLSSTNVGRYKFKDFLKWAKKPPKHRPKRSYWRPEQGGKPFKEKKTWWGKGLQSFHSTRGSSENTMTREERIQRTVLATVRKKVAPTPVATGWVGEEWKTENWGLDSKLPVLNLGDFKRTYYSETRAELKPPPSKRDRIVGVREPEDSELGLGGFGLRRNDRTRKGDVEYTRRLEGVLTPLSSPVLQGASLLVYLASLHAQGFHRRGTFVGTPSNRDFIP